MAQQVTKRYRLLKDLNLPTKSVMAGSLSENADVVGFVMFGSSGGSFAFTLNEIISNPDWFEEVKDAPFEIEWVSFNRSYENGVRFIFQSRQQINPDEYRDKIKEAIENAVNGEKAPDIDQLERQAFEAGRAWEMNITNGYNGIGGAYSTLKYTKFEDYKNSKK